MNIIVVGCGKIGSTLVESLSAEGHDVVALKRTPTFWNRSPICMM